MANKRLAWGYKPLAKIHRGPRALALGVVTKRIEKIELRQQTITEKYE